MYDLKFDDRLNTVVLTLEGSLFFEDYQRAWSEALDLLVNCNCKRFLIDAYKHREIAVESKVWFKDAFLKAAQDRLFDDVKIARISSRYCENRPGVLEIFRHIRTSNFKFNLRLFNEKQAALEWLLSGVEFTEHVTV